MIAMYDLEDKLIEIFDSFEECAEYFNTTKLAISCYLCRQRKGIIDKKRDKREKRWVRLFKIEE